MAGTDPIIKIGQAVPVNEIPSDQAGRVRFFESRFGPFDPDKWNAYWSVRLGGIVTLAEGREHDANMRRRLLAQPSFYPPAPISIAPPAHRVVGVSRPSEPAPSGVSRAALKGAGRRSIGRAKAMPQVKTVGLKVDAPAVTAHAGGLPDWLPLAGVAAVVVWYLFLK